MNSADPTAPMSRQVGTLTLTVWPDSPLGEHQRYAHRIEDTATGQTLDGRDLFTGAGAAVAPDRAMRDLAGYLTAAGDARQHAINNPGSSSEHEGLFPGWVAETAHQNADALALLGIEDSPQPKPDMPQRPRPAPDSSWFDRLAGGWVSETRGRSL
jgi:hypothetical protein